MTVLCATDLDRTLIYSGAAVEQWGHSSELVVVERRVDRDASFMTTAAAVAYEQLAGRTPVVPVTTRTSDQLARVRLPGGRPPFAVAANGGVLMVDGTPDDEWAAQVEAAVRQVAPLAEFEQRARDLAGAGWIKQVRTAEALFCYAVLHGTVPDGVVERERERAASRGWRVSLQGHKLYWVPGPLTKSAAVAEVARRIGATRTLAAGDSRLDADLLAAADAGILARHGELAATDWRDADQRPSHVRLTSSTGVDASTDVVRWFAANCPPPDASGRA